MLTKGSKYDGSTFQDWTPLVLGNQNINTNTNPEKEKNIKKREHPVTQEMGKLLTNSRNSNQLSRKEVAKQCGISLEILKNYESGIGMIEEKHISKLSNILKIQLKR
jgi:ribosome-binding protein aMBF1 (putative translation factor)